MATTGATGVPLMLFGSRLAVSEIMACRPDSTWNCFGISRVESGQSRVPEPPQRMKGRTVCVLVSIVFLPETKWMDVARRKGATVQCDWAVALMGGVLLGVGCRWRLRAKKGSGPFRDPRIWSQRLAK